MSVSSDKMEEMNTMEIRLPEIGEGVTEGELVKWLVKPGDKVTIDQAIAEMMTDKATVEVPSPRAGVVKSLHCEEGQTVEVGKTLLTLTGTEEQTDEMDKSASSYKASDVAVDDNIGDVSVAENTESKENIEPPPAEYDVLATPSTRRLARELNIDINHISGTGLSGRVTRDDVLAQMENHSTRHTSVSFSEDSDERIPLKGIRKKIAEKMQASKRIVPHFTLMEEACVTRLVKVREEMKASLKRQGEEGVKITYMPFVIKALIATLKEFPMVNASIDDEAEEIIYRKTYNIGFAADTKNGLLVPVIHQANKKSLRELSLEVLKLGGRARDGKLSSEEMRGATITITNIGSVGGTYATPIINHPEVAILGMYKMTDRVVPSESGTFKVEKFMNFTLTADHRLIDGAVAARFLAAFVDRIENPSTLMLDLI